MTKRFLLIIILFSSFVMAFSETPEKTITISSSYNSLLSNPQYTGMLDLILKEAFRRIGWKAIIVFSQTANSLEDVNNGLADAEMNRIEGMEKNYPNLVRVPESNMVMEFVAFSKNDYPIESWESIRDLHIGVVKGWKIYENNTAGYPNRILVPTEFELFRMLDKGRIDIALYSRLAGYSLLKETGYKEIYHLTPPLAERPMYMYLHKSRKELAQPLAEALRAMKRDGTYQKIAEESERQLHE